MNYSTMRRIWYSAGTRQELRKRPLVLFCSTGKSVWLPPLATVLSKPLGAKLLPLIQATALLETQ